MSKSFHSRSKKIDLERGVDVGLNKRKRGNLG